MLTSHVTLGLLTVTVADDAIIRRGARRDLLVFLQEPSFDFRAPLLVKLQ